MKESFIKGIEQSIKNFDTTQDAINYYQYIIDNNPIGNVLSKELKEFYEGLIMGLKAGKELKQIED